VLKIGLGLRGKLLVATLTLLLLPIASYFYLIELETYLKDNQVNSQLESSRLMAGFFDESAEITQSNQVHNGQQAIYAYPLKSQPRIDGYSEDWKGMYLQPQQFYSQNQNVPKREKFNLLTGFKDQYFYFFLSVNDSTIRYNLPLYKGLYDRVKLSLLDKESNLIQDYFIETEAPGWFKAKTPIFANTFSAYAIKGEWQENNNGYQIEFSVPKRLIGSYLAITIYDNGMPVSSVDMQISNQIKLNPLVKESQFLNQQLKKLQQKLIDPYARLYLINQRSEVIARAGEFDTDALLYRNPNSIITHLNNLYQVLIGLNIENRRYYGQLSRLNGKEIDLSLGYHQTQAKSAAAWLAGSNSQTLILSTASPIYAQNGKVLGALVLEKTNAAILALQDQTFEKILLISLIIFISTAIILLVYSGRLVNRILKLQMAAEQALTQEGKLNPNFPCSRSSDEIGHLSRSFSTLMQRLNQYTSYLESLAGKLSHELRTPLSVIKSSLENMQFQGVSDNNQVFMERALDGSKRLSLILTRMGEASRLEQAIQSDEKQKIEMIQFIQSYMDGIKTANPHIKYQLLLPSEPVFCWISPELIAQLLDKLIENAISFHELNSSIKIELKKNDNNQLLIDVFNCGPWIDSSRYASIFDSMVSHREAEKAPEKNNKNKQVNLGLGLHIARLISEYHQAELHFFNRQANKNVWPNNGVSFVLSLKIIK